MSGKFKGIWVKSKLKTGVFLLLLYVCMFCLSVCRAEEYICKQDARVKISAELTGDKAYELAKLKICYKAVLDWLRSEDNAMQRRNWEIIAGRELIFQEPEKYFTFVKILNKEALENEIYVKAEVGIDGDAVADLIAEKTSLAVKKVNSAGLTMLFVARAAESEIVYTETSSGKRQSNEGKFYFNKSVRKEKEFTTRIIDTMEVLTNVTASLNDTGLRFYNVQAVLPYMEDSSKLEDYLGQLDREFAFSNSEEYKAGSVEKTVAFIQREIKILAVHPRYFALGKIDIGNTIYNKEEGLYRGTSRCSITLWDLEQGLLPVKIVTTPLIAGVAEDKDARNAQKGAAEIAAEKAGRRVIDRIYNSFLENLYEEKREEKINFSKLAGRVNIDTDETVLYGGGSGDQDLLYIKAESLYKNGRYTEAFNIAMRLALTGYAPAMNMLGDMYRLGQGVEYNSREAVEWYRKGMKLGNYDASYNLALCYLAGVGVGRDSEVGLRMLEELAGENYLRAVNELAGIYYNGNGVKKDLKKAVEYYKHSAESGSARALYNLAMMYHDGVYFQQDSSRSREFLEKVLSTDDSGAAALAAYNLGFFAERGIGQPQDFVKAVEYYSKAISYNLEKDADEGRERAQLRLAKFYLLGIGVEKNYDRAFELCKEAVLSYSSEAKVLMGQLYEEGLGVNIDYKEALRWFEAAAAEGEPEGYYQLAVFYRKGLGGQENKDKCVVWYKKAQELGSENACVDLGNLYLWGRFVKQSTEYAIKYYELALGSGSALAARNLALLYSEGEFVEQNYEKSRFFLRKSIALGSVEALNDLAVYYYQGRGVEKNNSEARKLYEQAAARGSLSALENLGIIYRDGIGVEKDTAKAVELFEKAGEAGLGGAWEKLGMMFEEEESGNYSPQRAMSYYRRGAETGSALSMYALGKIYDNAKGVPEDKTRAYEWYLMAAKHGAYIAQYYIGLAYEYGRYGFETDYKKAVDWYKQAAVQGYEEAAERAHALRYAY